MAVRQSHSSSSYGWLYNFFAQVFWGTGGIVISLLPKALPSTLLVGIRHGIGAFLLGLFIFKDRRKILYQLPFMHLLGLGVLAGALPDLLLVFAVRHCGPIVAVLLARLEIPLGVLFAHVLLKEKVTGKAYLASLLGMLGAILIAYRPGLGVNLHNGFYVGVTAGVAAGIVWALTSIYGKYILNKNVDPLAVTFTRLSIGSITSFIAAGLLVSNPWAALQALDPHAWALLIYLGIFASGIGYLFFYHSLRLIDAHVAQVLIGISIATLIIFGLFIGQHISIMQTGGIIAIVGSIYLIKTKPAAMVD